MPYLDLLGHRLHYRIDGDDPAAPWLVFCNSLGTDLHMRDAQVAVLSRHFRILRYDRRGHGESSAPPPPYSLADLGGDVIALLDRQEIEKAHFCGLSIGGLTGQWLAINAGHRIDKVVICAAAAKIGTAEGWAARMDDVRTNGLTVLTSATSERWFTPTFTAAEPGVVGAVLNSFAATSVEGYAGCCAALAGADLREEIKRIANPFLAISGDGDSVCPPSDLEYIAAVYSGAGTCRYVVAISSISSPRRRSTRRFWIFFGTSQPAVRRMLSSTPAAVRRGPRTGGYIWEDLPKSAARGR